MSKLFNKNLISAKGEPESGKSAPYRQSAFDYALGLLDRGMQTVGQLNQKLGRKGYSQTEIDDAIKRLAESGFVNDNQYAQIYFENLKKYKLFGYFGIKKKLMERRISASIIAEVMSGLSLDEEAVLARKFLAKKLKSPASGNTNKNQKSFKEKNARALQARGFRGEIIARVLGEGLDQEILQ